MTTTRLSRRDFLRWSALVGAGTAVAACAIPTPQVVEKVVVATPVPKEPVKVFLWNADPIDLQFGYNAMIEAFNEKYAGSIVAENKNVPGGGWDEKLLAMIAANQGPDAWFGMHTYDGPKHGHFQNLTPLIERDGIKREELWFEFAWKVRLWHGQQYHVPRDVGTGGMAFNKNLFDAAGLPYPTEDWTTDDFVTITHALRNKEKGIWGCNITGGGGILWGSGGLPGNFGFDLVSMDGRRVKGLLDSPQSIETIQWYLDLQVKYDVTPTGEEAQALGAAGNPFATGKLGIGDASTWGFALIKELKFPWGLVPAPRYKDNPRHAWVDAVPWVMWSGAKHKDEIWELLKFISGPEGSKIPHQLGQYSSPCPSVWKELGDDKDPIKGWFLKQFEKKPQKMYFFHTEYFWKCVGPDFMGIWTRYIEQNERPLENIVKDAADKIQKCLDEEYAAEA